MLTNLYASGMSHRISSVVYLLHYPSIMTTIPLIMFACLLIVYYCTMPPKKKVKTTRSSTEELVPPVFPAPEIHELDRPHNVGSCGFCIITSAYEAIKPSDYTQDMWPSNHVNKNRRICKAVVCPIAHSSCVRLLQCFKSPVSWLCACMSDQARQTAWATEECRTGQSVNG
jgi:hypothetical protein